MDEHFPDQSGFIGSGCKPPRERSCGGFFPVRGQSSASGAATAAVFLLLAGLAGSPGFAAEAAEDELTVLRAQVKLLSEQVRQLEARMGAGSSAGSPAQVAVRDGNVALTSADRLHRLRLRGTVQTDSRWYVGDDAGATTDGFILRRARILMDGTFGGVFHFQIIPEFGGRTPSLVAANLTFMRTPSFHVRLGRFKQPVGLEHLQPDADGFFVERSLATNLVAGMDLGLQVGGSVAGGKLDFAAGVFNGTPDGTNADNADFDDGKTFAARLMFSPVRAVSLGLGGSYTPQGRTEAGLTDGYRTEGQQTVFRYAPGVALDGESWRVSPQLRLYHGSFGLLAEHVRSAVRVAIPGRSALLEHTAWQLALGYVVTGEPSSYGGIDPARPFDPAAGSWGAVELVGRISALELDRGAFPFFAQDSSIAGAQGFALGVNWYLSPSLRFSTDYFHSSFEYPENGIPSDVTGERAVLTRMQLVFE